MQDVIQCDLNETCNPLVETDIGVFSGVLEYLNDLNHIFEEMKSYHSRLLFSYAVLSRRNSLKNVLTRRKSNFDHAIETIRERSLVDGWRNHFTIWDIEAISRHFGFIENVGKWGSHALFLVKKA